MPRRPPALRHAALAAATATAIVLGAGAAPAQAPGAREEAKQHFERGVSLFESRRFAEALDEFQQAYAIQPANAVLYDVGLVQIALGRPVEAIATLERYLAEGGASIPAARRAQVETELDAQRAKVGEVTVGVSAPGAEVRVDGKLVGRSPLGAPVRLAAGTHALQVYLEGHKPSARDVEVAGRGASRVDVALEPLVAPAPAAAPAPPPSPAATTPPAHAPAPAPPPPPVRDASAAPSGAAGWIVGGAGALAAGAGAALFLTGTGKKNDAARDANAAIAAGDRVAWDAASSAHGSGKSLQTVGAVVGGVGVAALAVGAVMILSPGGESAAKAGVSPWMTASGGGVAWSSPW